MPWTDVRDIVQAARIVQSAARLNAGVLVDPIHFDRAGSTLEQLAAVPPSRLPYLQFCDAPALRPTDVPELLRQAREDRRLPGEGGLDLVGLLHTAPSGVPLSLEVPLAGSRPAHERARLAIESTQALLAKIDP